MKFCMHCGKEIKEKVKFCPFCGGEQKEVEVTSEPIIVEPIIEEVVEEVTNTTESHETIQTVEEPIVEEPVYEQPIQPEQPQQQYQEQASHQQQNQQQQNGQQQGTPIITINQESVNQFTDKSKNYLSYLNKNVLRPILKGKNENGIFGLVTFLLINTILAFSISFALGKISYQNGKLTLFLPVLLILLVGQAINVLTVHVLSTKIFKMPSSLTDAFEHMYAPISSGVYITLAMLVLAIISPNGISVMFTLLFILVLFLINISYIANLWTIDNSNSVRNKFYWTIGFLIVASIIQFIVNILLTDIVGASIFSVITDVLEGLGRSFIQSFFF
ncbi:zinc ribbon domain-containing protein [Vagococcus fluvialis]|uniref:zinc ribbon domain-containing protein n=1 Tax=Vagococcus fluvialis TaxID=2738 RepID=UPI003B5C4E77